MFNGPDSSSQKVADNTFLQCQSRFTCRVHVRNRRRHEIFRSMRLYRFLPVGYRASARHCSNFPRDTLRSASSSPTVLISSILFRQFETESLKLTLLRNKSQVLLSLKSPYYSLLDSGNFNEDFCFFYLALL